MFTTGRIIFVSVFVLVFVAGLIWSYRKEKALNKIHFNKTYKIVIGLILFLLLQFLIVKIRKFLWFLGIRMLFLAFCRIFVIKVFNPVLKTIGFWMLL